ncbi:MAG: preprotein translocase subunit SecA [Erysipelotrichaceae bacterium]|nr:preprotein translocase subunit SecA [Erysipelotrichaceae bacterium]
MGNFIDRLLRVDERALKKIEKKADLVLSYEEEMKSLSDEELQAKTPYFKELLANGKTLDDILPEAFAVCREADRRIRGEFPYKVQVMGAIILHEGDVAEMRTGEGKTLTATMAVYLNALSGKGVHVVTVNEYLAARDCENMGKVYNFLGLTCDVNLREKDTKGKQDAYNADITYTTNSELGFDYLRDNMAQSIQKRVLRGLNFAIVDEADSILIDESRTPLIISGGERAPANTYIFADRFVKSLRKERDFTIDVKTKSCNLTDSGADACERAFGITNLYAPEYNDLVHRIHQALKANYVMKRNVEYMVADGEIHLIDQFTGRIMKGREYSDGLQQAIQAKENVNIKQETITMATITYQNFFRIYNKVAGMTGTAKTEEEEFEKIYNMHVTPVPTNKPVIRKDDTDLVYGSEKAKYKALIQEIKARHALGQPILVGTPSVEASEVVHELLVKEGLKHEVLNAKNHEREALIIENAGQMNAITIATNMAGRGTDIKLGEGVRDIVDPTGQVKYPAGLAVLGTERHESRRIDNQLRGRSGRQGDPGYSRFFVSIEDELLIRFAPEYLKGLFEKMGDIPLESKMVTNAITSAQKKIEGQNFDTRKSLLDYDDVLRQQRETMYAQRDTILYAPDIYENIYTYFKNAGKDVVNQSIDKSDERNAYLSAELLKKNLEPKYLPEGTFDNSGYDDAPIDEVSDEIGDILFAVYNKKRKSWPEDVPNQIEKMIALRCVDRNWTTHIDSMAKLKEGIGLRGYARTDPLKDYVDEGWNMFNEMITKISNEVVLNLLKIEVRMKTPEEMEQERLAREQASKNEQPKGE